MRRPICTLAVVLPGRAHAGLPFLAHLNALRPRVPTLKRGSATAGMPDRDAVVKARGEGWRVYVCVHFFCYRFY